MIVSLGEALIDCIHDADSAEPRVVVGGSPYNVAVALSRLGCDAGFLCPISLDDYGQLLVDGLRRDGVTRCVTERVGAPTAIAEVFADKDGHPSYVFHREGTADRALEACPPVAALPEHLDALHFGSLVLAQEADWPAWREAIIEARSRGAFIAFDPNLRVALIDDMAAYRARLEEALELADLVKASDEDMALLAPGCVPAERVQRWCSGGRLVVLTEGALGAQCWTGAGEHAVCRPERRVAVVDTVGAGDTFQAALLAWLVHRDYLGSTLGQAEAEEMLAFATYAAGLNCTKVGCQPPVLADLDGAL